MERGKKEFTLKEFTLLLFGAVVLLSASAAPLALAQMTGIPNLPQWPSSTYPVAPPYSMAAPPTYPTDPSWVYSRMPSLGSAPSLNPAMLPDPAYPPAGVPVAGTAAGLVSAPHHRPADAVTASNPPSAQPPQEVTLEQVREEAKKYAWTKGDFRIVPYGILWFNMAYETQRTVDGDYVLYVYSPDVRDYDAFHVSARATRLGLDVAGPKIPFLADAPSSGKVEIDFFSPVQVSENRASVMLRHAYVEVKNDYFRILAGQTWDLMSPLLPNTLMYSVGWGVGNLGYRRAQLRYERYFPVSDTLLLTLQGAMATNLPDELAGLNGDHEGWPIIQMRTAVTLGERGKGRRPITLGCSGHIGEQFYARNLAIDTDDVKEKTWSCNVDVHVPITERLGFQGEFFTGANLGPYMGGIVQGVNPVTGRSIRSTGGWVELWYDWTKQLRSVVGYGIDDPINRDVHTGGRLYNDFIYSNISYNITEKFLVGFEYKHFKTHYQGRAPGESDHFELAMKCSF